MLNPYRSTIGIWMCLGLLSCDQPGQQHGGVLIRKLETGGSGTVVSDPPGIDCGPKCAATFPLGTTVTLTARADVDAAFVEWRGHRLYEAQGLVPLDLIVDEVKEYKVEAEFGPRCTVQNWCRENPVLPASRQFHRVWGTSEKDVWAVGSHAVHWNGSTWTLHWSAQKDGYWILQLWGSSPNDYWAISTEDDILHWDGVSWREVPDHPQGKLGEIWGSGPQDVWIVGEMGLILHWDGKVWFRWQSPTTKDIRAVWGTGPADAWAVGGSGLTLHWDGTSWVEIDSNISDDLVDIWGSGKEGYLARGIKGFSAKLYRWDGKRWAPTFDVLSPRYSDIWGSGPDDVWILNMPDNIHHFDGVAWSSSRLDFKRTSNNPVLFAVGGTGPKDVWLVGTEILHRRLP